MAVPGNLVEQQVLVTHATGMYVVRVIDPNGCMAADTIGRPAWQLHASQPCNLPMVRHG